MQNKDLSLFQKSNSICIQSFFRDKKQPFLEHSSAIGCVYLMKKLLISLVALIALLAGCNQSASQDPDDSPEDIAKIAYEWEKNHILITIM